MEESVRLNPQDATAPYLLGWSYNQVGRHAEALGAFQQAVRLKPDYALAYGGLGWTLNAMGRHREALEACTRATSLKHDFPDAHYNLGMAYVGLANRNLALRQHEILLSLKSNKADLLLENIRSRFAPGPGAGGAPAGPRWPWTSWRQVTEADLSDLSWKELELMRNEIYARHGWVFQREDLKAYFLSQAWYRPRGTDHNREEANR